MQLCFQVEKHSALCSPAHYIKMPLLLYWTNQLPALDSIAEADIYQKYDEMTKGKSSVYISHRLASTRFCSRILMLEQGEIQEEGTHEELLRQSGKYAALYEVQSKYYREGDGENEDK